MKIKLTEEELNWLLKNCAFPELSEEQKEELWASFPMGEGEWQPPDFAYDLIRKRVSESIEMINELDRKMEEQTIRGTFNINLSQVKV